MRFLKTFQTPQKYREQHNEPLVLAPQHQLWSASRCSGLSYLTSNFLSPPLFCFKNILKKMSEVVALASGGGGNLSDFLTRYF